MICLDVFLVADRYDAADGQDPRADEWPPAPARVFSALRAVAHEEDLPLLRELETLTPPVIHASEVTAGGRSRTYVVTNTIKEGGGNLNHPGRTSGLKERRSIFPAQPRVQLVWHSDNFDEAAVARLDNMARRVPYLGRSTSVVLMGCRRPAADVAVPDGMVTYEPSEGHAGDLRFRVPYSGYLEELDALHAAGLPAWQASDGGRARHSYQLIDASTAPDNTPPAAAAPSPYQDMVVLRFRDHHPAGRLLPIFTTALRSMVMGQTKEPLPPALHGHGLDGEPHVAYLGLPVCGPPHADGHLVALAVAIPGMDENERRRTIRGILGDRHDATINLKVPGFRGHFPLEYLPDAPLPRAAAAWHWRKPSRQWVTATPVVLDTFPKRGDLAASVARSVSLAGLPEPADVEVSTQPMTTGAVVLTPRELPRRARGRIFCHARVRFDEPVAGPVLVGAGRYFGVGLFSRETYTGGHP